MTSLTPDDFATFFQEVHGNTPFPWQAALVERILAEGHWPDVLDVPTGLGKTSVIDIAVFVAAARPELGRRRLFFVVDRRLIIDEAYEHARTLASALSQPMSDLTKRVAEALRQADDTVPLQVTRMRGGLTWSWRWLDRPDRFAVIVGTVDQVGSRLLFRGYSVGEHLRSIDAALVGVDSMIVIDEAHLSEPFRRVVKTVQSLDPGDGPRLLTMSATVTDVPETRVHRISEADEAHETARQRLHAKRHLHLLSPSVSKNSAATVIPEIMSAWAQSFAGPPDSGNVVGVICNTVARARAVFDQIPRDMDRLLLIGRARPIDREYLLEEGYERIRAGRTRSAGQPMIVVTTQTIEVGANVDFDSLVTESAALSALIQRLGRLDRLGQRGETHALVVHDLSIGEADPVYGAAREATWSWLTGLSEPLKPKRTPDKTTLTGGFLASPIALRALLSDLPANQKAAMQPEQPYIPDLHDDVLDSWMQTSPAPHADPPVAPYLHGIGRGKPDVAIVWRSGLPTEPRQWEAALQAVPPVAEEALEAPIAAVRRWLSGIADQGAVSDLEGEPDQDEVVRRSGPIAIRYLGPGRPPEPVGSQDVEPGDMIVVRTEHGGCDKYGWAPGSTEPVIDLADLARRRGRPIMRLRPELHAVIQARHPDLVPAIDHLLTLASDRDETPSAAAFRRALPTVDSQNLPFLDNLRTLGGHLTVTTYLTDEGKSVILSSRGGGFQGDEGELDSSTNSREPLELATHELQVAQRAAIFADNLRLPSPWKSAVVTAARWHDEGKRDPRFQAMLHQRPARALGQAPMLAKSGMDPADRAAFHEAGAVAGYPKRMRHEALSARIATAICPEADDLVIHLIATHHGRGRPLLPPIHDPDPQHVAVTIDGVSAELKTDQTIDLNSPQRFATLNAIHGRWHLALLETLVRLADIWCSERDEAKES